MADVQEYLDLIPSQNAAQPDFLEVLRNILTPFAELQNQLESLEVKFDVDVAVGQQLDFIGQWVGFSRRLPTPIPGVYFSFDTSGVGFDEGVIWAPGDPLTGITLLPDDTYRLMILSKIAANIWDGSLIEAERILAEAFALTPLTHIFIQDNADMSIDIGITGQIPSVLFQELVEGDYLPLRGAAVRLNSVIIDEGPLFGFDTQNYNISGFDTGILSN